MKIEDLDIDNKIMQLKIQLERVLGGIEVLERLKQEVIEKEKKKK
tara:strand:- start:6942 stop:7076 length:135 start_codon:yes stop_codon:yes gene_type:complete